MYLLFFCESSAWLQPEELAKSSMISTLKPSVVDLVPYNDSLVLEKSIPASDMNAHSGALDVASQTEAW